MNDIFEKNIEALKKAPLYKYLYTIFEEECVSDSDVSAGAEIVEEKKVLYAEKDKEVFLLDSMYSSEKFVERWVKEARLLWNSKFFIFGMGNGMLVRKILELADSQALVFLYEPSVHFFRQILSLFDISDVLSDKRLILFTPEHEKRGTSIHNIICSVISYADIANARVLKYPNYKLLFPEESAQFDKFTDEIAKTISINTNTVGKYGKLFVRNSICNATLMVKGKKFSDIIKKVNSDVPGILVSCGPSLDKNIDELKNAVGKAIIVAGDSSVKAMMRHGIVPDLYVTVDMEKPLEIFQVEGMDKIPAVCLLDATYDAIKNHKGDFIFLASSDNYIGKYMNDNKLELAEVRTGGCEAASAFSFMLGLGIKTFVFVGQDLAYTGNVVYASDSAGASWNQQELIDADRDIAEGIDGKPVLTSSQFNNYRLWFERQIKSFPEVEFINATEGGARIHGTREDTLRNVINRYCTSESNICAAIREAGMVFDVQAAKEFAAYMRKIIDEINNLEVDIKKGIELFDETEKSIEENGLVKCVLEKFVRDYQENSEKLNSLEAFYYIECMVQDKMKLLHNRFSESDSNLGEILESIHNGRERYKLLMKGVELFKELWDEMEGDRF